MILVSVIVPIFKVENFIRACAESLMNQTLQEGIEYIFVDDCSPDTSIQVLHQVLEKYPSRRDSVKIVHHEVNKGLPAARNTGLEQATGKYVFHCDSDDFLELDALEHLVNCAEAKNADIVWCDWFLSFEQNERLMKQPDYATADDALRGMLRGKMKYNVWNKLARRSLYAKNAICFPEGHSMGEDMTMIRLMACATNVTYIPKAFYHYVKLNGEAFTNHYSAFNLQAIQYNVRLVEDFILMKKGGSFQSELSYFKLSVKFPFLISSDRSMYRLWKAWFPESNASIPQIPELSWRSRLLQWAAWKGQFWLVWLHYQLVYRLVYGYIYK